MKHDVNKEIKDALKDFFNTSGIEGFLREYNEVSNNWDQSFDFLRDDIATIEVND